jgi:hypothetical protein
MDSFEIDVTPLQVNPLMHPRIGMTLIPFSERHQKKVEELDQEHEKESGPLAPDVVDGGDDCEELEAGTTTTYPS